MSSLYCRKPRNLAAFRSYGFKKVSPEELEEIVERMQKRTYTSNVYHGELFQRMPSPPRPPSAICKKAPSTGSEAGFRRGNRMSDRELNRLTRRLCRPTIARMANEGLIAPDYETDGPPVTVSSATTPAMKKKIMERIRRPTTASKSKLYGMCVFCEDPQMSDYMDIDFSRDKIVSQEEIDDIVKRAKTPTIASGGGIHRCKKHRETSPPTTLPMVSGLSKTKRVDEIVNRLYTPPVGKISRTPRATECC